MRLIGLELLLGSELAGGSRRHVSQFSFDRQTVFFVAGIVIVVVKPSLRSSLSCMGLPDPATLEPLAPTPLLRRKRDQDAAENGVELKSTKFGEVSWRFRIGESSDFSGITPQNSK